MSVSVEGIPSPRLGRGAWVVVGVLWIAGFLNYFDRLLLISMRDSLLAEIPMSNAQFGLLTSSFLWVYGFFSPLGGFLADQFGRRLIILLSVALWSVATWYTGQVHSFAQLLWARAFMGVSEACYLPAALALISNHHPGTTRSLATGFHNTGLYVGAGLGGVGGYLASHYGWRLPFTVLGGFGVLYAGAAAALLKEAVAPGDVPLVPNSPAAAIAARALLYNGAFWLLAGVFCIMSVANWFAYGWMPHYLQQQLGLGAGAAGLSATGYTQAASFLGIIVGGIWADRWSIRQRRARSWVAATGFSIAAPALLLIATAQWLPMAILGLVFFGISRGFFDANGMPILRQVVPERFSATGYGVLNFFGCLVGGLVTYGAGALLDAQIPLRVVFEGIATAMAVGAVGLALLRPAR